MFNKLDNWLQNSDVGVSKETYIEMCEMMGTEPNEDDMPLEMSDFPYEAQQAVQVFGLLKDVWDPFGGNYLGKDLSIIFQVFDLLEIDHHSRKIVFKIVQHLDHCRAAIIKRKQDAQKPSK